MEIYELKFTPESYREVSKELLKQTEFFWCFHLTLALLLLFAYLEIGIEFCLIPLILYNLHQIFLTARELSRGTSFLWNLRWTFKGYILTQQISDCTSKVALIIHNQLDQFPYGAVIGLVLPLLINFFYLQVDQNKIEKFFHANNVQIYFVSLTPTLMYCFYCISGSYIPLICILSPGIFYFFFIGLFFICDAGIKIYTSLFGICEGEKSLHRMSIFMSSALFLVSAIGIYYIISLSLYFESNSYEYLVPSTTLVLCNNINIVLILMIFKKYFKIWLLVTADYEKDTNSTTIIELLEIPSIFRRVSENFYLPITRKKFKRKNITRFISAEREDDIEVAENARSKSEECEKGSFVVIESEESLCSICFQSPSNIVVLPCGHGGICDLCSLHLNEKCHICRNNILRTLKIKQDSQFAYVIS